MPLSAGQIPLTQILRHGREVEIRPALAARILDECRCQYHTPPATWKVDYLADEIKAGKLPQDAHLWLALLGESLVLLGGWVRLAAVVRSGMAVRFLVGVTPVDSPEQLRGLARRSAAVRRPAPVTAGRITPVLAERRSPALPAATEPSAPASEDAPLVQILRHGHEVRITPALAERIEKECRYEHERPLKKWRLDFFASEIEGERFEQGRQLSFALFHGKLVRMNGQHRGQAVVVTGKPQTFMIEVKPVANEDQLAALYATYDTEGRTLSETAGPLMKRGDLGKEQVATLLRAVQFLYTGFHKVDGSQAAAMRSHVVRNQVADDWYPCAARYFELTEEAPGQVKDALRRQSVAAVALYTLRFQPEKAAEFWQGLAMDDGLARRDPRKALLEKLRSGDSARSIPVQMHAVAVAWKAFSEGRKMKEVRVRLDKPFAIAGTPLVVERLDEELGNA